jgi:hypothetical protein
MKAIAAKSTESSAFLLTCGLFVIAEVWYFLTTWLA